MIFPEIPHVESRYAGYTRGLRKIEACKSAMIFANVAIDSPTRELGDRLFTYEVPPHLRSEVFVGSQVLVPLGNQNLLAGYVVSLEDARAQATSEKFQIKPVTEVLESEPLFDRRYVEFLHFVADYYAASIAEVIAAAVPADLGTRVKRIVRLVKAEHPADPSDSAGNAIIAVLKEAPGSKLSIKALKQRSGIAQSKFYASLARLRQGKVLTVEREGSGKVTPKTVQHVLLGEAQPATAKQEEIVAVLKRAGGTLTLSALCEEAGTTAATIKRMVAAGICKAVKDEVLRDPLLHLASKHAGGNPKGIPPTLTDHQSKALAVLETDLNDHLRRGAATEETGAEIPWLLHGVTGSGKTEVYMRLIDAALKKGRSALMLVPEISLTPQLAERLVARFGDLVAVWHSGLSAGERFDTWRRLRAGQAKVLLGARSAILAHISDLGLIILDEEHDSSYKQSNPSPRYNAKTLAIERARRFGAMVVLGSATPDVATYTQCKEAGKLLELPQRVFQQALPDSVMIDMRSEQAMGNRGIFSRALKEAIDDRLRKQQQTILLINRRGYASHVFCRACGFVTKCKHCSVSLVFHQINVPSKRNSMSEASLPIPRQLASPWETATQAMQQHCDGYLMCHHCGFRCPVWETCPACQSPFVKQLGLGTQRVEEEARLLFPTARLLRLDSDTTSRRGAYEEIFRQFAAGQADILIGTQIVAKGLDIPRVTLVGVLAADSAFNLPDYRSSERGFQLLTQVSGRAGRGAHEGQVMLQTYSLDLPALVLARNQDYLSFVQDELQSRHAFEYPPYSQIIRVVVAGEIESEVEFASEQLAEELSQHLDERFHEDQIKIVGPAPCLISRLRGKYRHHLIVKNLAQEEGRRAVTDFLKLRRGTPTLSLAIDVDALDLV